MNYRRISMDWADLPRYSSMSGQMRIKSLDAQQCDIPSQRRWCHHMSYALRLRSNAVASILPMANKSIYVSIAADDEENTMKLMLMLRVHHYSKNQRPDELLANLWTDPVALEIWKPLLGLVKSV
jgi:hypothetical protein